jgi:hypothetical protein
MIHIKNYKKFINENNNDDYQFSEGEKKVEKYKKGDKIKVQEFGDWYDGEYVAQDGDSNHVVKIKNSIGVYSPRTVHESGIRTAEMRDEIQDDEIQDDEIQDEIQDDEISEPDDDDCFINCNGWNYNVSIEGKHIGKFVEIDDAEDAIRTWAKKNKWYPSCWFISDHGNISSHEIDYQM